MRPVVDLIVPGSPIRAEVLDTLKARLSGRLYGTTPEDKQTGIDVLLAMLVDLVDGPAPPQHIDVADVEIETTKDSYSYIEVGETASQAGDIFEANNE